MFMWFKSLIMAMMIALSFQASSYAKTMSDVMIGEILCYDRFGPVDSIGVVVKKDLNRGAITIEYKNIFKKLVRKSFPIGKIKDPLYCRAKSAAQRALLKKLLDSTASE